MKLEIYQVGKLPPLTVVECDGWYTNHFDELICTKINEKTEAEDTCAVFFTKNIAGFKEVSEDICVLDEIKIKAIDSNHFLVGADT